ncbi:sulfotransferase family 2 domain-containing protein [Tropicimonas marinistellae]|uniref:sulfotransferase family 2 domain-containing protein n=1 Tax=Tropicimonas marinistellae TaxID=1739787 RepID=UPI0008324695|nr:sulfotransferase family 2 domain-containing protein [Tropicimonas marinistellae]
MPILKHGNRLILFIHIPKTGGTSVEAYMRQKGPLSLYHPDLIDGLATTPQHLHAGMMDSLFDADFFDARFAVLRDPLDRLVSEFRWRARVPDPKYARFGLRDLSRRGRFLIRGKKRFLTFDEWVAYLLDRYPADPFIYGNHLRPQHEFLRGDERLFRLEDGLEPVFRWLDTVTETAPGTAPERQKPASFQYPEIGMQTRDRVRTFYAQDYALLERLPTAKERP